MHPSSTEYILVKIIFEIQVALAELMPDISPMLRAVRCQLLDGGKWISVRKRRHPARVLGKPSVNGCKKVLVKD